MSSAARATAPSEIPTARLHLRPWRRSDAAQLLPVLRTNAARLGGWIPSHVAAPVPLPDLEDRLAGFAADFAAAREWRFAIFSSDQDELYGEVDLFFRSPEGRVPLASADRLEIGYWLRGEVTGRGYATEAARAMIAVATTLPAMRSIEIRCDPRNEASAAVPRRLGFRLLDAAADVAAASPVGAGMVWVRDLTPAQTRGGTR
jgi:RimJ/RimL family protein N-acetyltransferase